MIQVTLALKQHMTEHFQVPADAADDVVRKAVADKLAAGELDIAKYSELIAAGTTTKAAVVAEIVAGVKQGLATEPAEAKGLKFGFEGAAGDGAATGSKAARMAYAQGAGSGDAATQNSVRIKSVVEQFDDTRTSATYERSESPFLKKEFGSRRLHTGESGRYLDMPTDRQKAIAGAWFKLLVNKSAGQFTPHCFKLTELDRQLIEYAMHECKFVGPIGNYNEDSEEGEWLKPSGQKLTDLHRKTLLDESSGSGGQYAVPVEFDDLAVITPLLNGELFPLVTVRNVGRRRQQGFAIGNPTMDAGTAEGTAHTDFDTTGFVSDFSTTLYPIMGSIELGQDMIDDSPVDMGGLIMERFGQHYLKLMDDYIASGNGTSVPLGVNGTSGAITVTSDYGSDGPWTVSDLEGLLFAVKKQYRQMSGKARSVFIGNETTYSRVRGIKVGANDQRRVFGMDEENYGVLEHPFKINETLANTQLMFACLDRYRFYRRSGFAIRVVTGATDATLAGKNTQKIFCRSRVGGKMELGGAVAIAAGQS